MTSSSLILFSSAIFLADGEDLAGEDFVSTLTSFTSSFTFSSLVSDFLGVGFLPLDSSKIPKYLQFQHQFLQKLLFLLEILHEGLVLQL